MYRLLLLGVLSAGACLWSSAKPPIDPQAYGTWPSIKSASLSPDGRYAAFRVSCPDRSQPSTLVLRATESDWHWEQSSTGALSVEFASDGVAVITAGDELTLVSLGRGVISTIPGVRSCKLQPSAGRWLAYIQADGTLVLDPIGEGKAAQFAHVAAYAFSPDSQSLVIDAAGEDAGSRKLVWRDIASGRDQVIWQGANDKAPASFTFDGERRQLAFVTRTEGGLGVDVWVYDGALGTSARKIIPQYEGLDFSIGAIQGFSNDGRRIMVSLIPNPSTPKPATGVAVDVWSYRDPRPQSQQLFFKTTPSTFGAPSPNRLGVLEPNSGTVIRIEGENELALPSASDTALILQKPGGADGGERLWNPLARSRFAVASLSDGTRQSLPESLPNSVSASPKGKYVVFYNPADATIHAYEPLRGIDRCLTKDCDATWIPPDVDRPDRRIDGLRIVAWLAEDAAVIVSDGSDLWALDLSGTRSPKNLTLGYGRAHNVTFRPAIRGSNVNSIDPNATLILSSFNRETKDAGFFRLTLGEGAKLEPLLEGPYVFDSEVPGVSSVAPTKARDAEAYLVVRQTAESAPTLCFTKDFKSFRDLSDVQPQRQYNWLTTELYSWPLPNGKAGKAILYRPENFDPHQRYPVIFHYYEQMTDRLHAFPQPAWTDGALNLAWYVSNGYIVVTPDISFRDGAVGRATAETVLSAADALAKEPWVDAKQLGIQGHSFGGFLTNYLVTHSTRFAAAMSAAGLSDLISAYGTLVSDGGFWNHYYETGQGRMGGTLWEKKEAYLENSPVLNADKITTPILLMANKADVLNYAQEIEFFGALRRLGKKAWLLQYDHGRHTVSGKDAEDLDLRMRQFFDHYLRGAPPPRWMTEGIPAIAKGVDPKLDLDVTGKTP